MTEEAMFKRVFSAAEPVCKINLSIRGVKCDKADTCSDVSDNCKKVPFGSRMVCDPTKRWMYCHSYKQKLGMVFDKDLGVYILPEWKDELLRRAKL